MFIFLTILLSVVSYLVMAGVTYGYAKHRWPVSMVTKRYRREYSSETYTVQEDENSMARGCACTLWPFYWTFIWPVTKANELTFSSMEKRAGHRVVQNKARIAELTATSEELKKSNDELAAAEEELDKEVARGL